MSAPDTTTVEPSRSLIFDEESLRERVQGSDELFNELVEIFLDDLPKRMEEIRGAVSEMNMARIERAAHTLKGTAASMSAQRLASVAKDLELSARSGAHERVPDIFANVLEESERLRQLLAVYHCGIKS